MALVNLNDLFSHSMKEKYIVGAFNVFNLETVRAVVGASHDTGIPVIVSVGEQDLEFIRAETVVALTDRESSRCRVPVCLHLDHGTTLEVVVRCLRAGFTSVMIDPSQYSEEEGLRLVNFVVEMCRAANVSVESMVGKIHLAFGEEGDDQAAGEDWEEFTDPQKAREFVGKTGVDALAVSVGTEHGSYLVGKHPELHFDLLGEIARTVDTIPLVVHGGSAIPEDQLLKLRDYPVGKLNIGSLLRAVFRDSLMNTFQNHPLVDAREALKEAERDVRVAVVERIRQLSC